MSDTKDATVRYYNSNVPVLPGDKVISKGWLFKRKGEIVYVPGVSKFNSSFHEPELIYCGLRHVSGTIVGVFIYPSTYPEAFHLRETIHFIERGTPTPCDLSGVDEE